VPNTESAKKSVRQTARRRARNNWRKRRVKDQVTTLLDAIQSKDVANAEAELKKTAQLLDKIAATGTIHKNTAARKKSRLTAKVRLLKKA
jgi:small subunit ribosomal protein S20